MTDIWPVTIIRARYGGVCEGGEWIAFNLFPHEIPPEVLGDHRDCEAFFGKEKNKEKYPYAVGNKPQQALYFLEMEKRKNKNAPDAGRDRP